VRYIVLLIAAVSFGLVVLQVGSAHAERRVALVVGNADYRAVAELPNPRKDARDVAAALRAAGFTEVVERYDLGMQQMRDELAAFEDKATGADWAVVYYAGHGIEVDGRNFLVPIDAELKRSTDVEDESYALDRVLARVAAAGKLQLVILDACRENPFKRRMAGLATRAIGERGLARIEPAHPNVIVAYAARDGEVALDGKPGENSPYARALLKHLAEPGLELGKFFRKVRDDVLAATGGRQRPFEYGSLTGQDLFFKPGAAARPKPPAAISPPQQSSGVERAWAAAKDSTSIAVLEAFRRQYGAANAFYDRLAEARIEGLKQAAETAKKKAEAEAQAKERERLAMLQREEQRKRDEAEAARKKAEDDARTKVEAERRILTDSALIKEAQERLYELNYDPGPADGTLGRQTERAIRELEASLGLEATGRLTAGLLDRLKSAAKLAPWGAIVFSDTTQKWGMSWRHDTRKAAVADAQASCAGDPAACSRVLTFFGAGCGAFAHSATRWSLVARDTSARARLAALEECEKDGARCSIVGTVCADGQGKSVSVQ
jgi:uncharacterized caspase-like protein